MAFPHTWALRQDSGQGPATHKPPFSEGQAGSVAATGTQNSLAWVQILAASYQQSFVCPSLYKMGAAVIPSNHADGQPQGAWGFVCSCSQGPQLDHRRDRAQDL